MSAIHRYLLTPVRRGPWTPRRFTLVGAYLEGRKTFAVWQRLSTQVQAIRVMDALTQTVRQAASVPYYRELIREAGIDVSKRIDVEAWRRLPPLEKATLRTHADALIPPDARREWLRSDSTGGSTGAPVKFKLGPVQQGWRWAAQEYIYGLTGFRPGDRVGYLWGGALDLHTSPTLATRISDFLVNQRIYNCFRLDDAIFEHYHAELTKFRPRFFVGYAAALALFANFLQRRGFRPSYPQRAIITGAEKLELQSRKQIESVFSVPVYESYGSRDCGGMAMQADPGGPLRILLPHVILEPFGEVAEDGSREILVTHLEPADGTVMLRYRVGDRGVFDQHEPFATCLSQVSGRALDHVVLPSGRIVHSVQFPHLFKDYDIVEYQVVQSKEGGIVVSLVAGVSLDQAAQKALQQRLSNMMPEVSVAVVAVPHIERNQAGKWRPVISHYEAGGRATVDGGTAA